jgi:hypothetical protein
LFSHILLDKPKGEKYIIPIYCNDLYLNTLKSNKYQIDFHNMTLSEIAEFRLSSQQITETKCTSPKEVVGWLGAMQAQDYGMAKWAVGCRLKESADKNIENAINKGEILRIHVLRPTWHLVSPDDVSWMLELTSPQIRSLMKSWDKGLELDQTIFSKSNDIISKALSGGNHLTREELMAKLEQAKINTSSNRSSHIMIRSELDGIVCSGEIRNKKQTYALLSERVPVFKKLTKEEALAKLAITYFTSHGPATIKDFTWWSGLLVKDARNALELVRSKLNHEQIDSEFYWFSNSFSASKNETTAIQLLPAFDEFIISYKDRRAALTLENQKRAFTLNGIFRPVIVADGQVIGLWKRTIKNNIVIIETETFLSTGKKIKKLIELAAEKYGHFMNMKNEIKHHPK